MTITWTVSHADRLVTTTITAALQTGDVDRYLAELAAAGAMPYGKLIDLSFAPGEMSLPHLKAMMRSTEGYAKSFTLGPIALLIASDFAQETSALYGERTKVERPFRIFREMLEARVWLALQSLGIKRIVQREMVVSSF